MPERPIALGDDWVYARSLTVDAQFVLAVIGEFAKLKSNPFEPEEYLMQRVIRTELRRDEAFAQDLACRHPTVFDTYGKDVFPAEIMRCVTRERDSRRRAAEEPNAVAFAYSDPAAFVGGGFGR